MLVAQYFFLLYQVPGFILYCFKRPQVNVHLHLVLALEILWHPPRVPADAASAILEFAGGKYVSCLIYDFGFWRRNRPIVLSNDALVLLRSLADNGKIYRDSRTAFTNFGLNKERRAQF